MRKAKLFLGSLIFASVALGFMCDLFTHYEGYSSYQVYFKIGNILLSIILMLDPSPLFEVVKINSSIFSEKYFENKLISKLFFALGVVVVLGFISLARSVI